MAAIPGQVTTSVHNFYDPKDPASRQALRLKALEYSITTGGYADAEGVVGQAQAYYDFISQDQEPGDQSDEVVPRMPS